jgi:hypothetical protein
MRGDNDHLSARGRQSLWLARQVQLSRGHWRREEQAGAIRSAGWWESVTVTWSPAPEAGRRPRLLRRALATAVDTIAPSIAELVAASARRLLEGRHGRHPALPSSRQRLPTVVRELPRSEHNR